MKKFLQGLPIEQPLLIVNADVTMIVPLNDENLRHSFEILIDTNSTEGRLVQFTIQSESFVDFNDTDLISVRI